MRGGEDALAAESVKTSGTSGNMEARSDEQAHLAAMLAYVVGDSRTDPPMSALAGMLARNIPGATAAIESCTPAVVVTVLQSYPDFLARHVADIGVDVMRTSLEEQPGLEILCFGEKLCIATDIISNFGKAVDALFAERPHMDISFWDLVISHVKDSNSIQLAFLLPSMPRLCAHYSSQILAFLETERAQLFLKESANGEFTDGEAEMWVTAWLQAVAAISQQKPEALVPSISLLAKFLVGTPDLEARLSSSEDQDGDGPLEDCPACQTAVILARLGQTVDQSLRSRIDRLAGGYINSMGKELMPLSSPVPREEGKRCWQYQRAQEFQKILDLEPARPYKEQVEHVLVSCKPGEWFPGAVRNE